MEENIGFHGCKQGESGDARGFVEEFGASDLAVGAVRRCVSDDHFYQIHLSDHILEGADIGIGNLAGGRDVTECV